MDTGFTRRAALAGAPALLAAQSPNDTARVAFIGVGGRGSEQLAAIDRLLLGMSAFLPNRRTKKENKKICL